MHNSCVQCTLLTTGDGGVVLTCINVPGTGDKLFLLILRFNTHPYLCFASYCKLLLDFPKSHFLHGYGVVFPRHICVNSSHINHARRVLGLWAGLGLDTGSSGPVLLRRTPRTASSVLSHSVARGNMTVEMDVDRTYIRVMMINC